MSVSMTDDHGPPGGGSSDRTPCNPAYHPQICRISQMQPLSVQMRDLYRFVETPEKWIFNLNFCSNYI